MLLNSNFGHLPTYFMSLFVLPGAIAHRMEKMQREFFWGDSVEKKRVHLVKWDVITKKKENGGLGVKNLGIQNLALLAKWWGRFGNERESLWVKVIKSKYGLDYRCWVPQLPSSGKVSNLWKGICSIGGETSRVGTLIHEGFKVQIGNGELTLFWKHAWCGANALRDDFPRLFMLSNHQEATVMEMKNEDRVEGWNLFFRRDLYEWELVQLEELYRRVQSVAVVHSKDDMLSWKWSGDNRFEVRSLYGQWEQSIMRKDEVLGPIWRKLSPPKVEIFVWMAVQNRVASKSLLARRNLLREGQSTLCAACDILEETLGHILLHCNFAWSVWAVIMEWWQMQWVCPPSVAILVSVWLGNNFRNLEKHIWEATLYATLWTLWLTRNDRVFNNKVRSSEEVGDVIKTKVAMWMKVKFDIKVYSVDDFKNFLSGIRRVKI